MPLLLVGTDERHDRRECNALDLDDHRVIRDCKTMEREANDVDEADDEEDAYRQPQCLGLSRVALSHSPPSEKSSTLGHNSFIGRK